MNHRSGLLLAAAICSAASAQSVSIEVDVYDHQLPGWLFYETLDSPSDFTFTNGIIDIEWTALTGEDHRYRVLAVDGPTTVRGLQIHNVHATSTVAVTFQGGGTGIELVNVLYIGKGDDFDGELHLPNLVVDENLTSVVADSVGSITLTGTPGSLRGVHISGSVDGSISTTLGDPGHLYGPLNIGGSVLGNIHIEGSILGDVTVGGINGVTGFIRADRFIGAEYSEDDPYPFEIVDPRITIEIGNGTLGPCGRISAWEIYADIDVSGALDGIDTRALNNPRPGDFVGSLKAKSLTHNGDSNSIVRDLDASVELSQPLQALFRVGRSFVENLVEIESEMVNVNFILLPEDGLTDTGQIVFNTSMSSSAVWESPVLVDAIELDEPEYAATSNSLGGGAVGMSVDPSEDAGYSLHDESCIPTNGGIMLYGTLDIMGFPPDCIYDTQPITLVFYGPLIFEDTPPLLIEYDDFFSGWINVTNDFNITLLGSDLRERRRIKVEDKGGQSGRWTVGDYRITAVAGRLTSRYLGEESSEPDVNEFTYEIEVVDGCQSMLLMSFDFNEDDSLCEMDFTTWAGDPCDLNNDEVVDCDDIALLLGAIDLYETITAE